MRPSLGGAVPRRCPVRPRQGRAAPARHAPIMLRTALLRSGAARAHRSTSWRGMLRSGQRRQGGALLACGSAAKPLARAPNAVRAGVAGGRRGRPAAGHACSSVSSSPAGWAAARSSRPRALPARLPRGRRRMRRLGAPGAGRATAAGPRAGRSARAGAASQALCTRGCLPRAPARARPRACCASRVAPQRAAPRGRGRPRLSARGRPAVLARAARPPPQPRPARAGRPWRRASSAAPAPALAATRATPCACGPAAARAPAAAALSAGARRRFRSPAGSPACGRRARPARRAAPAARKTPSGRVRVPALGCAGGGAAPRARSAGRAGARAAVLTRGGPGVAGPGARCGPAPHGPGAARDAGQARARRWASQALTALRAAVAAARAPARTWLARAGVRDVDGGRQCCTGLAWISVLNALKPVRAMYPPAGRVSTRRVTAWWQCTCGSRCIRSRCSWPRALDGAAGCGMLQATSASASSASAPPCAAPARWPTAVYDAMLHSTHTLAYLLHRTGQGQHISSHRGRCRAQRPAGAHQLVGDRVAKGVRARWRCERGAARGGLVQHSVHSSCHRQIERTPATA